MPKFKHDNRDRALRSKSQGSMNSGRINLACRRCGMNHKGECIVGSDAYFGCGKSGHGIRDCPLGMW